MLTKTELMCGYMTYDGFDGYMWDNWFHLRLKAAGHTYPEDRTKHDRELWQQVLDDMPKTYNIDIRVSDHKVTFEYEDGEDVYDLSEFYHNDEPEIKVKMLERHSYWDGPISGIAEFEGRKVYYDMIDEGDLDQNRKYMMYELNMFGKKKKNAEIGEFYWFQFEHYQKPRTG